MTIYRCVILVSLLTTALTFPLHPQAGQTVTAQMGLRGPVGMVQERMAFYEELNGDWVRQTLVLVRKVEFNEAGRLVALEEYHPWGLMSSWEKSFDPDGFSTSQLYYNTDGSVSQKLLQRFDAAGEKLSEIEYDEKSIAIRRWERSLTTAGTVISYTAPWGQSETARYDSQGRLTEMRKDSGSNFQKWTYSYDALGRLAKALYSDNAAVSPDFYTFLYDSKDKLLEVSHSQNSEAPVSKRRYSYSATGRPITKTVDWFDRKGTLAYIWNYRYDSAGNVVEKEYSHGRRPFSCRWAYRYDGSDRITMETFYDSDGRIFTMTETTYDGRGNKVAERSSGRGVAKGFQVIYEYDATGRLLETVRSDLDGRQESRKSSRYNELGDLIESTGYNPDGSVTSSTKHLYIYDEGGNWIEMTTTLTDNAKERYDLPTEIVFRTISYYP